MITRPRPIALSLSLIGCTLASLPLASHADDTSATEQITVTAQSRSQQSQAVPIALQVVTGEQIDKLSANNLADMNGYLPGFQVNGEQATQPFFSLRGLGTMDFGIGTDSPLGIYVDGVYTGKTGGSMLTFDDVQRIEVLKGPQGTLFGRNSAAGAISIVTNEPDPGARRAEAKVKLGQYGQRDARLLFNQPLSDASAFRLSVTRVGSDGWLKDAATGESLNSTHDVGARASFLSKLGEGSKVMFSWEHEELGQPSRPAIGIVPAPAPGSYPAFPINPATLLDPLTAPAYNQSALNHEGRIFDGATLRLEVPLTGSQFQSTTAYRRFHSINSETDDGTRLAASYLTIANLEKNRMLQQEFRLSGQTERIDWVGGISYFQQVADQTAQVNTTTDSLDNLSANMAGMPIYSTINQLSGVNLLGNSWQENMINHGRNTAVAAYGDVIWHLDDRTNLTTGVRFTRDSKTFSWFQPARASAAVDAGYAALGAGGFFDAVAQQMGPEVAQALQGFLTQNQLLASQGANGVPLEVSNSWRDVSPRLVLDHTLSPDRMVYASVSKGYQAGGYNTVSQVGGKFDPETVWNYEIGSKNTFRDLHLTVNASLFAYRFTNLQALNLVNINGSGMPVYQVTVGDQKAHGVDFDIRWQPTRNLRLYTTGEYLNQTYGQYKQADGPDLSGQPVGAPLWTVAGGVDYTWQGVLDGQLMLSLQDAWQSKARCNDDSAHQGNCLSVPAFTVGKAQNRANLRLRWDSADRRWHAALLVSNLFDQRYVNRVGTEATVLGAQYATINAPRMTALEVGMRW
ncbi:TonB-dependent receptor [Burkholderiaceae bacterium DAT-1]|nr:TonB-dependent receptor [Burkholderiaceae bacterium DAT-1]